MRTLMVVIVAVLSTSSVVYVAANSEDTGSEMGFAVDAGTSGGSATIGGTEKSPGGGGDAGSGGDGGGASGGGGPAPGTSSPSTDGTGLGGNPREIQDTLDGCEAAGDCAPAETEAVTLTLDDLASFTPAAPSIRMEPDGWMLRGVPVNALAIAPEEAASGALLGHPIEVRFAPTAYTWTWGDGSSDTFSEAGRTWDDLGLPRFSETPTSHVYRERGTVTVGLTVIHSVAYRLDGGAWVTVDGTVSVSSESDAYVASAQTVIVPGGCDAAPDPSRC